LNSIKMSHGTIDVQTILTEAEPVPNSVSVGGII